MLFCNRNDIITVGIYFNATRGTSISTISTLLHIMTLNIIILEVLAGPSIKQNLMSIEPTAITLFQISKTESKHHHNKACFVTGIEPTAITMPTAITILQLSKTESNHHHNSHCFMTGIQPTASTILLLSRSYR